MKVIYFIRDNRYAISMIGGTLLLAAIVVYNVIKHGL
jgi:hypothetical protein